MLNGNQIVGTPSWESSPLNKAIAVSDIDPKTSSLRSPRIATPTAMTANNERNASRASAISAGILATAPTILPPQAATAQTNTMDRARPASHSFQAAVQANIASGEKTIAFGPSSADVLNRSVHA